MKNSYSQDEINAVKSAISAWPTNHRKAFEEAAKQISRSTASISAFYYKTLRNEQPLHALISKHGAISNVKNTPRLQNKKSVNMEIAELSISLLTKEERVLLLKKMITSLND